MIQNNIAVLVPRYPPKNCILPWGVIYPSLGTTGTNGMFCVGKLARSNSQSVAQSQRRHQFNSTMLTTCQWGFALQELRWTLALATTSAQNRNRAHSENKILVCRFPMLCHRQMSTRWLGAPATNMRDSYRLQHEFKVLTLHEDSISNRLHWKKSVCNRTFVLFET